MLPDTAKEKPQQGEVLAVGPGRMLDNGERVALEVKTGDTVLFAKYAGTEFKLEDDELLDPQRDATSWPSSSANGK